MEQVGDLLNVPVEVITAVITIASFIVGLFKGKRDEKKKLQK